MHCKFIKCSAYFNSSVYANGRNINGYSCANPSFNMSIGSFVMKAQIRDDVLSEWEIRVRVPVLAAAVAVGLITRKIFHAWNAGCCVL